MKKLISISLILLSIFLSACTGSNTLSNESKVRENVWEYVKETGMPRDEEWKHAWLNGKVEEYEVTDNLTGYIDINEKYHGQTVLLVTPVFETKRVAYPTILVDPETEEVIEVIPGE